MEYILTWSLVAYYAYQVSWQKVYFYFFQNDDSRLITFSQITRMTNISSNLCFSKIWWIFNLNKERRCLILTTLGKYIILYPKFRENTGTTGLFPIHKFSSGVSLVTITVKFITLYCRVWKGFLSFSVVTVIIYGMPPFNLQSFLFSMSSWNEDAWGSAGC